MDDRRKNYRAWDAELSSREPVSPREALPEGDLVFVGSSRVDLQACKLEYSIVSPK